MSRSFALSGIPALEGLTTPNPHLGLYQLPIGLSEWAVHHSLDTAESRALEPDSWRVRKADLDFLTSPEARDILEAEGIVVLDYRASQRLWLR